MGNNNTRPPVIRAFLGDEVIADNFAGGGGASLGIELALGRSPDIAVNHDAEAIAMHAANHPAEEPHRLSYVDDDGEYCESCCRPLAIHEDTAEFTEDDGRGCIRRVVLHRGPCPPLDLWYPVWTYATGETGNRRWDPRPFEQAYGHALRWRIAGGAALTSVRLVRVRKEVSRGR